MIARALVVCIALMLAAQAQAQPWPNRPIKLVVPTGPGAATDVMARLLSDGISRALGQPVVVENQAGASGIVALRRSRARRRMAIHLLFTNTSGMIYQHAFIQTLPYDPERDFTPVASVCSLRARRCFRSTPTCRCIRCPS